MPFTIERNDLASVSADAIVVAANEDLHITGGVGEAVAQVAGFTNIQEACNAIGHCPTGSAVATPAFNFPARIIIHAVGPIWQGGTHNEVALLRSAYDDALSLAAENNASSIALPLLSAGIYGFPADISLSVAQNAIHDYLESHDAEIRLVLFNRNALQAGLKVYDYIKEYIDDVYVGKHTDTRQRTRSTEAFNDTFFTAAGAAYGALSASPSATMMPSLSSPHKEAEEETSEHAAYDKNGTDDEALYAEALAAKTLGQPSCLSELLDSLDASFSTTLLALIDAKGMTDVQVYKRANMSRQLFSKIRSDALYKPTKKTVLALAIALELDLDATEDLLRRAGYALSHSSKADVIVEYFIMNNQFDIFEINAALYAFDQPLL
ncbi:MAG: macro domain-containing protein [Eggerthellaceae bacterium]|nr:macro domain-containing protein [Eggerthellaceae bacterium]